MSEINYYKILENLISFKDSWSGCVLEPYSFSISDDGERVYLGFDGNKYLVKADAKTCEIDTCDKPSYYSDLKHFDKDELCLDDFNTVGVWWPDENDSVIPELKNASENIDYWITLSKINAFQNHMTNINLIVRNTEDGLDVMSNVRDVSLVSMSDINDVQDIIELSSRNYKVFNYKEYNIVALKNYRTLYEYNAGKGVKGYVESYFLETIIHKGTMIIAAYNYKIISEEEFDLLFDKLFEEYQKELKAEIDEYKEKGVDVVWNY